MKLKYIQKACQVTDKIFHKLIQNFNFQTEIEVANFISNEIKKHKLKPSFPMIVASERNYHHIHHYPKKHQIKGFTIIDFGVKYKGYCSDLTRMVYIGKPKKSELQLYNLVLKTQQKCLKKLKIGLKYRDLDAFARVQLQPHNKEA